MLDPSSQIRVIACMDRRKNPHENDGDDVNINDDYDDDDDNNDDHKSGVLHVWAWRRNPIGTLLPSGNLPPHHTISFGLQ